MLDTLAKSIDLLKASGWQAAMIAAACGVLLYLSAAGIIPGMDPGWILLVWAVMLTASGLAVAALLAWLQRVSRSSWERWQHYRAKKQRDWINQNLDTLGAGEREVLSYMVERNQRSLAGRLAYGGFGTLVQKGLLIRGAGQFNIMEWPHTVPEDVWDELVRRRDEFVDPESTTHNPAARRSARKRRSAR